MQLASTNLWFSDSQTVRFDSPGPGTMGIIEPLPARGALRPGPTSLTILSSLCRRNDRINGLLTDANRCLSRHFGGINFIFSQRSYDPRFGFPGVVPSLCCQIANAGRRVGERWAYSRISGQEKKRERWPFPGL